MRIVVCLILVCSLVPPTDALTQQLHGGVTGRILTEDGEPLPDVSISVSGPSLQGQRSAVTDGRGYFQALGLPVGVYSVRFERIGFRPLLVEQVHVRLGDAVSLGELRLIVQPEELDPLVVTAGRVLLDVTSSSVESELEASAFEVLPTERAYKSIIELLPHANASFYGDEANVGGSTGLENIWYVDGVNVTDPANATTGTDLPYNFIKGIEVTKVGSEAEQGRGLGGIVNVVTRSGSNEFEASGYGFFTSSALSGDARLGLVDATVRSLSDYDLGLSLGGPIVRDRLWFFGAYNPSFTKQDIVIPGHGSFRDDRTAHRFAGKTTWQAAEGTDVELSIFGDPTEQSAVVPPLGIYAPAGLENPDLALQERHSGGVNVSLRTRTELSARLIVEALLARHQQDQTLQGATETSRTDPLFQDATTGIWEGGVGEASDFHNVRTSASLTGTILLGSHTLKAGAQYEDALSDISWHYTRPGIIEKNADSLFTVVTWDADGNARSRVPTLWIQDSWRAHERLTLNAGLRWETQYFIGVGDTIDQAITGMLQPRLGAVLRLGEIGTQKLFGSWGRFYQQLPNRMIIAAGLGADNGLELYSADPREQGATPFYSLYWHFVDNRVEDLEGEHLDQFALGYERLLGQATKLSVTGIHRELRALVGYGFVPPPEGSPGDANRDWPGPGNLGEGELSFLPKPERRYTALELTLERAGAQRLNFLASYVLSRSYGNYSGMFVSDVGLAAPQEYLSLEVEEQGPNSTGLLPNDRPHVFKLSGSYRFELGLTAGTYFTWQSGTPRNVFGASSLVYRPVFLAKRGSAGRTPSIWDLNFRFTYDLERGGGTPLGGRLVLDLLHVGSQREPVWFDQQRYLFLDDQGNQANPNPHFGQPMAYQPPFMVRLGFETRY